MTENRDEVMIWVDDDGIVSLNQRCDVDINDDGITLSLDGRRTHMEPGFGMAHPSFGRVNLTRIVQWLHENPGKTYSLIPPDPS